MKFETPKMNITMFSAKNVLTTASSVTVENAKEALTAASVAVEKVLVYTFD